MYYFKKDNATPITQPCWPKPHRCGPTMISLASRRLLINWRMEIHDQLLEPTTSHTDPKTNSYQEPDKQVNGTHPKTSPTITYTNRPGSQVSPKITNTKYASSTGLTPHKIYKWASPMGLTNDNIYKRASPHKQKLHHPKHRHPSKSPKACKRSN